MGENEEFSFLKDKIITKIENEDNERLVFTLDNNEEYMLFHRQSCCESVSI